MFSGIYQSVVILGVALVFYLVDTWLMRRFDPQREDGSSRNWVYTIAVLVAGGLMILQPLVWPRLGLHTAVLWGLLIQVAGLGLVVAGLALHWWARMHLGRFYAERSSDIQKDQHVVRTGPYAHVRHPIYTSYFLLTFGLLLVNPAVTQAFVAAYACLDFSLAIRREEKLLVANVPGYAEYRAQIPAFFPLPRRAAREQTVELRK